MQLLELTLHNYKIHRKKTLIFEPGVVGIIGDNGCGKSSIFSAICFLFTGEVDVDKKADLLTLGEAEGWVKGKFTHNNKEGTIERHISSPKIVLTYDGITYNKVTEVNLLWSEMLQIDAAVFNNVIVAKQGEIQNLFSDESVIREKIFQKIFMVPPTEKIRSCIWDNYIKACPPEKLEEDIQLLQANQVAIAGKRNEILSEIDRKQINSLTSIVLHSINNRISFLKQCQSDLVEKPAVEFNLNSYKTELGANEAAVDELKVLESRLLAKGDLQLELNDLIVIKTKFEQKQSLAQEILNLSKQADRDSLTRLQLNLKALNEQTEEKRNE